MGFSSFDGPGESFMAEILAVKHGLSLAWSSGYRKFCCESDYLEAVQLFQRRSVIVSCVCYYYCSGYCSAAASLGGGD